ncbi:MAG TPA: hypothetical protein VFN51_01430 [Candidatus Saccharimonadales bacterium]|nr:hypothetical protein [Candidatus Saccharimonadales bacterium]
MDKAVKIYFPRWASALYAVLAVLFVPWIVILAEYLPSRHIDRNWDALWVGFDLLILIAMVLTIYFMLKRRIWVIMSATALATLLLVDIWFDIMTAKPGREQDSAILMGIVEITLSLLTFWLVYHLLHHTTPEKNLNMLIQKD